METVTVPNAKPRFKKLWLTFEKRDDNGLRVYSEDVPGFVLSHSDSAAVFSDIKPALELILSERFGAPVIVGPLQELREKLEDDGFIPIYGFPVKREYVAQFEAA